MEEQITKAFIFANDKHGNTKRKYSGEPYIIHLQAVYQILRQVTDDSDVWIAGILHDTIEDTNCTYEELEQAFGKKVAEIVKECTKVDEKTKNYNITRKEALLVKFADGLHNLGNNTDSYYEKKMLCQWKPHALPPELLNNPRFK